jgi:hypothetical protein
VSADSKDIEASGALLIGGSGQRERRLELVRKLLKLRESPRAVEMLKQCLERPDEDPEVLKTVILGLGFVKDRSLVKTLQPFLEHSNVRVIAATIKSLLRIDPNMEASALNPLLASKDDKARTAAMLALLSTDKRLGEEMVEQLSTSPTESFRTTAASMLDAVAAPLAERLRIDMFIREPGMELIKELARSLKRSGISEPGLEKLNTFRAEIKAAKPADPDAVALRHAKVEILDRLCRRAYEKLDMSAGKIGLLEGQVEKQASHLAQENEQQTKKTEEQKRTDRHKAVSAKLAAQRAGPPWQKMLGLFVVVAGLGAGMHFYGESQKNTVVLARPTEKLEEPSALGKRGERVSVEAEILRVYAAQKSVALKTTSAVMVMAVFAQLPPAAKDGAKVRLEGTIHAVKSLKSITVVGDKLALTSI